MPIASPESLELTSLAAREGGAPAPADQRWGRRAVTFGIVATVASIQVVRLAGFLLAGRDIPLPLAVGATNFLLVPLLLVAVDRLLAYRSRSIISRAMVGAVVAAFAGGMTAALFWSGTIPRVARKFSEVDPPTETIFGSVGMGAFMSLLIVGGWSLAAIFPRVLEQEKVRALQLANLQLEAAQLRAQGELARLRGQLEPHFLLNTLNLIAGLVGMDTEKARSTIVNLGDLLRDALEPHGECQSLDEELQWLERYGEILAARHGPSLAFEWDVDPDTRAACLPRLLLQPLVENAIMHGALRAEGKGRVSVRARRTAGERIEIAVEDNGPGLGETTRPGAVGVANVRRRLELTRPDATLSLATGHDGTRACLSLPYARHVPGEGKR